MEESARQWQERRRSLRNFLSVHTPDELFSWEELLKFTVIDPYEEMEYLKKARLWKSHKKAIFRSAEFSTLPAFYFHPINLNNIIHQAFCLSHLTSTGKHINQFQTIVEFGGGYGSLCGLIHALGYRGSYILFDLPEFAALQRFYLKSLGLPVKSQKGHKSVCEQGVEFISKVDLLRERLQQGQGDKIFISIMGLSDTSISFRTQITSLLDGFSAYLINYQHVFREVDNAKYFLDWQSSKMDFDWHHTESELMARAYFLVGLKQKPLLRKPLPSELVHTS